MCVICTDGNMLKNVDMHLYVNVTTSMSSWLLYLQGIPDARLLFS